MMGGMMNQLSMKRFMMACALALAVAVACSGEVRAQAFTITSTTGLVQEVVGDPGGTAFANAPNSTAGQGLPTALGGWANGPGFAPDPSFGNNQGITGFSNNGAPLIVSLNTATTVRFTWYGKGDSTLQNSFQVDSGSGFVTLWGPHGTGVAYPPTGPVSYDIALPAGPIAFRWITGAPNNVNVANGSNLPHTTNPGFFAGIDPYLASGTFQTVGDAVFMGLTDLPDPGAGDHDYQDLAVRMAAVPEPASIILLGTVGAGFAGYQIVRRRRQRRPAKA
jgi:hypothetical protein